MRYIERAAFEGSGIQELSLDEIEFVSGGYTETAGERAARLEREREAARQARLRELNPCESYSCQTGRALQVAGAAAAVVGGTIAGVGLLTGPGEVAAAPIGGAIATAGGAAAGLGYLLEAASGGR